MYGEESLNDSNVQIALLAMLLSMQIQEVCKRFTNVNVIHNVLYSGC